MAFTHSRRIYTHPGVGKNIFCDDDAFDKLKLAQVETLHPTHQAKTPTSMTKVGKLPSCDANV
jgi:hypothetical protein